MDDQKRNIIAARKARKNAKQQNDLLKLIYQKHPQDEYRDSTQRQSSRQVSLDSDYLRQRSEELMRLGSEELRQRSQELRRLQVSGDEPKLIKVDD